MKIKLSKKAGYWCVTIEAKESIFDEYEAAIAFALKSWKRYYKEQSAFSRLQKINTSKLNIHEADFCYSLILNKCKGITKAQYGFLVGIYERQEREW